MGRFVRTRNSYKRSDKIIKQGIEKGQLSARNNMLKILVEKNYFLEDLIEITGFNKEYIESFIKEL